MHRAFVDSSVLIAAVRSPSGGSSEVLRYAIAGHFTPIISPDVISEVENHFRKQLPRLVPLLEQLLELIPFETVAPTVADVREAASYTPSKDKAIVAAAVIAGAGYLITLDKKHLLGNANLQEAVSFHILTPGDFLTVLRQIDN